MHRREYLLSAVGIIGGTTVGSVAYTSASVDRSVTSNIAADSSAIIGLSPGSVDAVYQNGSGQLEVDTSVNANGLNSDGSFEYGNTADASSGEAFSVTNNDANAKSLTVGLTAMTLPGSSSFQISLFQSDGTSIGTVTPSTDQTYSTWAAGETIYAAITIDTSGTTDTDSISGTINFSAN